MSKVILLLTIIVTLAVIAMAYPVYEDSAEAASGDEHHGRVQIKVYRGPSDGHEHFAPWGYWVKQPADEGHY